MPTVLQKRNEQQLPRRYGGPRIILLRELNYLGLRDKIGTGLAAVTNFDVFKISAGHRSILYAG
jgi:hypothetical protein